MAIEVPKPAGCWIDIFTVNAAYYQKSMNKMSISKKLYIVKLGDALPGAAALHGDFEHWIEREAGVNMHVVDPRDGTPLPSVCNVAGAIITGSQAMVTDRLPWSERTAQWLTELTGLQVPVLGICYGHQLLAHAHGGEVDFHPGGMEIGTVKVRLTPDALNDPLLGRLPTIFPAQSVHSQRVRQLPDGAVLLAGTPFEPNHAFRLGPSAWGLQFHPEFNRDSMRAYIRELAPKLRENRLDPACLEQTLADTPASASVLARFAQLVSIEAGGQ